MFISLPLCVVLCAVGGSVGVEGLWSGDFKKREETLAIVVAEPGRFEGELVKLSRAWDGRRRFYALFALCRIGTEQAWKAVEGGLYDKAEGIRRFCAERLYRAGRLEPLLRALGRIETAESIYKALAPLEPDGLLKGLLERWQKAENRDIVAKLLGATRDGRVEKALREGLSDPDPLVRSASAEALGRLGAKSAISSLLQLLNDEDEDVVSSAVLALRRLRATKLVRKLRGLLRSENPMRRLNALVAIRRCGEAEGSLREILHSFLGSERWEERARAVEALASAFGEEEPALLALMDESAEVRASGVVALRLLKVGLYYRLARLPFAPQVARRKDFVRFTRILVPRFTEEKAKSLILETLRELEKLKGIPLDDRILLSLALAELGDFSEKEVLLEEGLYHTNDWVRLCTLEILERSPEGLEGVLPELIEDTSPFIRKQALYLAGGLRLKSLVPRITEVAFDEEEWGFVRAVAVASLSDILGRQSVPVLQRLAGSEVEEVRLSALASLLYIGEGRAKEIAGFILSGKPQIARTAHLILQNHTGMKFTFDPSLPKEERRRYVEKWVGILRQR